MPRKMADPHVLTGLVPSISQPGPAQFVLWEPAYFFGKPDKGSGGYPQRHAKLAEPASCGSVWLLTRSSFPRIAGSHQAPCTPQQGAIFLRQACAPRPAELRLPVPLKNRAPQRGVKAAEAHLRYRTFSHWKRCTRASESCAAFIGQTLIRPASTAACVSWTRSGISNACSRPMQLQWRLAVHCLPRPFTSAGSCFRHSSLLFFSSTRCKVGARPYRYCGGLAIGRRARLRSSGSL